jgi:hypothetical protein
MEPNKNYKVTDNLPIVKIKHALKDQIADKTASSHLNP